jgi:probable phosphoglycerate mutase
MLLYLVRHAESLANAGQSDSLNSDLTELGRQQIAALAERFGSIPLRAVYCSPFDRCLATAEPIARGAGVPVRLRPEPFEYHHLPSGSGVDLGLKSADEIVASRDGVILDPDWDDSLMEWPSAEETFDDLLGRTRSFADEVKRRWTCVDDIVLVISHGSPVARIIDAWLTPRPGPSFRFIIDNAAVNAVRQHEGVSSLICLNEASHLVGLARPGRATVAEDGSVQAPPPMEYW